MSDRTLDPDALAQWYSEEGTVPSEVRPGVQRDVDAEMITDFVMRANELHIRASAEAFGDWLHENWCDFAQDGENIKQRDLIAGALKAWRGKC